MQPILSPIQPNNQVPKNLKIKVEQKEKAARRRLTLVSYCGKKSSLSNTAI
ncbi:hypothetical protein [Rickettsia akari]|uniref:hypothetical protein n=1 Tax=Rickettsia akari TaxID=786 RepID=UPI00004621D0|nr:hypothetical protein [Rickettsia akari]